jgi:hypothetical protein
MVHRCVVWHVLSNDVSSFSTGGAVEVLSEWCRSTTLPHGQVMPAKVILQLSEGMTPREGAGAHSTSARTIHRWRNRFLA